MENDLLVIMGASEPHGTFHEYLQQLGDAHIQTYLVPNQNRPNMNGGGNLGYRVHILRQMAEQFSHYGFLIISDAFDVTFYGSKEDVLEKIPTTHLLHGAEKNCYPDPSIASSIGVAGPWRFANGGLIAGTPPQFLRWCHEAETSRFYHPMMLDQQFLNLQVAKEEIEIDYRTNLFFCLFGGYDELQWTDGLPHNLLYETKPNFVHANGKWDGTEAFRRRDESLLNIGA